jgi:hypothetical protein
MKAIDFLFRLNGRASLLNQQSKLQPDIGKLLHTLTKAFRKQLTFQPGPHTGSLFLMDSHNNAIIPAVK